MDDLRKNAEGYTDPTAYKAIKNTIGGVDIMRGEIYEYFLSNGKIKKALIVSSDERENDYFVSIIVLEDKPKGKFSVPVVCGAEMWANCNCISYADHNRLGNFLRAATIEEMECVSKMMAKSLGLYWSTDEEKDNIIDGLQKELVEAANERDRLGQELENALYNNARLTKENESLCMPVAEDASIVRLTTERDLYKRLYEDMLNRMIG